PDIDTPAAPNHFAFHHEIVINEIMYHHSVLPSTNNLPPQASPEEWLELFNKSANAVDLTGWVLSSGITYPFPPGKAIAPGGYLLVAKDAATLRAIYPSIDIVGDYNGKLSGKGESVVLTDRDGNPANQVRYFAAGRWPEYADGGGSSLELRDLNSDNSQPQAWAASD